MKHSLFHQKTSPSSPPLDCPNSFHFIHKVSDKKILLGLNALPFFGRYYRKRPVNYAFAHINFFDCSVLIKLKVHYLKPSEAKKNHPFLHRVGSLFINFKDYYLDVTEAEFLMYRDLANKGIEHYWSRDIVLEQQVWKITTIVEEAIDGIEIILANPGLNNTRSAMPYPFFPGIFIYDSEVEYPDQEFQVTAAHEFGHVILTDAFGLNYSWRHKNTSTLFGNIYQNAPCCPVMGEIDLMQYQHNTYRLCSTDIHQRLIAHEDDVKTLLYISSRL